MRFTANKKQMGGENLKTDRSEKMETMGQKEDGWTKKRIDSLKSLGVENIRAGA